jgi:hypothetical protein
VAALNLTPYTAVESDGMLIPGSRVVITPPASDRALRGRFTAGPLSFKVFDTVSCGKTTPELDINIAQPPSPAPRNPATHRVPDNTGGAAAPLLPALRPVHA